MGAVRTPKQPTQTAPSLTTQCFFMIHLLLLTTAADANPHAPQNLTWKLYDVSPEKILNQTSIITTPGTWYPSISFDLCQMFVDHYCPDRVEHSHCDKESFLYQLPQTFRNLCPISMFAQGTSQTWGPVEGPLAIIAKAGLLCPLGTPGEPPS